jgi:hypothetical protein
MESKPKIQTEEPFPPEGLEIEWVEWLNMRRSKGKRFYPTPYAQTLAKNKLSKYSDGKIEVARYILQKAIERNWDGIFPLNDYDKEILSRDRKPENNYEVAL